jgi:AsmA protein
VGSPQGQEGAELAALKGLTVPVRLTGPFEAIAWQVQWSAVAAAAFENRIRGKLAEQLGVKPVPQPSGAAAGTTGPAASAPPRSDKDKLREQFKKLFK